MIAFEISHNGKVLAVAGGNDLTFLNAALAAAGDLSGAPGGVRVFYLSVFGTAMGTSEETAIHHEWDTFGLTDVVNVGDSIAIRVIETNETTRPTSIEKIEIADAEPGNQPDRQ